MNRAVKSFAGAALAAVMVAGAAGTALASPSSEANAPASLGPAAGKAYSDRDVVGFLVFGQGKAAEDHPALAKKIRDRRADSKVTAEQLSYLMAKLHKIDPAFDSNVTEAVQAKDPFVVQAGMERLNDDLKKYIAEDAGSIDTSTDAADRADGKVWKKSNIVAVANIAAGINVAVGTNVAAGAEVVVIVVIVPAAASYGFDLQQPNKLDKNNLVAEVAEAL
ncbi:sporulation delaying protein family toxin [Streptomyces goshikiensis]|uniref:sporulation delaying protein family toxin n=1 Tax=Streptomyces goshikiensis TaxID=1942 RepID=UPI003653CC33